MKYIMYAHTGSANHGCEALVRSTTELLGVKPTLYSVGYEEDEKYGVSDIVELKRDITRWPKRMSPEYILSAIQIKLKNTTTLHTKFSREAFLSGVEPGDVCLSIGGDNYCYAGTEILGDLNVLLQRKGAKTVLWGCSIDPEVITPSMVQDLKRYDLITVREPLTQAALKAAGVTTNFHKVADPAFLLRTQETDVPKGFEPGKTIGLNISPLILKYTDHPEDAMQSIYGMIDYILHITTNSVALIPHVIKEGNNDNEVLRPLYEHYRNTGRVILVNDRNCMELKTIISRCRLFIGARTHATIAAYSTGVPTLVIGYSVKSKGIAVDLFGEDENYVLPVQSVRDAEVLIRAYQWLEDNETSIRTHLKQVIPVYCEEAKLGLQYLWELNP